MFKRDLKVDGEKCSLLYLQELQAAKQNEKDGRRKGHRPHEVVSP